MFFDLIHSFIPFVEDVIQTILTSDLLSYFFYLGILGFILGVMRVILSVDNSHAFDGFRGGTGYNKTSRGGKK